MFFTTLGVCSGYVLNHKFLGVIQNTVDLPQGMYTHRVIAPSGPLVRYKESHCCESSPGVKSYAGYVDLDAANHLFFWLFESRQDPATSPMTLWMNGGPGSPSTGIGNLQEIGPCRITKDLKAENNPYAWNEESNLLFIDNPVGAGFSYNHLMPGSLNATTSLVDSNPVNGIYNAHPKTSVDTTEKNSAALYRALQAISATFPALFKNDFHIWAESYGG